MSSTIDKKYAKLYNCYILTLGLQYRRVFYGF